jgi:hypothetical protein
MNGSAIFASLLGQGERIEVRSSKPNPRFSEQSLTLLLSLEKDEATLGRGSSGSLFHSN